MAIETLTQSQKIAFDALMKFLESPRERFFRLDGYAGTGKTFLLGVLSDMLRTRFSQVGSAPTNKATKVFSGKMPNSPCKTIYSLLGIVMEANEDVLQLKFPYKPANLNRWDIVYVDESSMLNAKMVEYIFTVSWLHPHIKWVYSLDSAQLPPVGEKRSPVLALDIPHASLTDVVRYDNQILTLATEIRKQIARFEKHGRYSLNIVNDHAEGKGVWKANSSKFRHFLEKGSKQGLFHEIDHTKAVAWRNATVDDLNEQVRFNAYGRHAYKERWIVGDRVMVASPVKREGSIIANIDDEGTITSVNVVHNTYYKELKCYAIVLKMDDGETLNLNVIHEESENDLEVMLSRFAAEAKQDRTKWKYFWTLKDAFHKIRYSFALTSHRAQGSTFKNVLVDMYDIFKNRDSLEALKSFYVGSTRPTTSLIVG